MTTERNDIFPPPSNLPIDNLDDTADLLDVKGLTAGAKVATAQKERPAATAIGSKGKAPISTKAKPASKRRPPETKPEMTLQIAMASGASAAMIADLRERWMRFNQQEARDKAKAKNEALNKTHQAGRRKKAEELLALADGYDITLEQARKVFEEALQEKYANRVLRK